MDPVKTPPFRVRENSTELYKELKGVSVDVHLVCAYMVLGSQWKKECLFADIQEFSCTDPFLGYCYWFLMDEVFLKAAEENVNCIPGTEYAEEGTQLLLSGTMNDDQKRQYEANLRRLSIVARSRYDFYSKSVKEEKQDLFEHYFLTCNPEQESFHTTAV